MENDGKEIYELLLQKALTLVSKRRYTVLKLKKKLIDFINKRTEQEQYQSQQSLSSSQQQLPTAKNYESQIKAVLARLKELKYLDDTSYTRDYISNRIDLRPRGKFLLKRELKNKGIHPELAERLVEESEVDEEELAWNLLQKKLKQLERFPKIKQKEKAMRFLASRGFKIDAIYKVIGRWYNETIEQ
jgi:regulatory protein